jgi:hypothetical protein
MGMPKEEDEDEVEDEEMPLKAAVDHPAKRL